MKRSFVLGGCLVALTGLPTLADQVFNENVIIISDQLCVGTDCFDGIGNISFRQGIRVRDTSPALLFDDSSTASTPPFPSSTDWQLSGNDASFTGANEFAIEDITNNTIPVLIEASAPSASLHIAEQGNIGMGTIFPSEELHISAPLQPTIRLEQTGAAGPGGDPAAWAIAADFVAMGIRNETDGRIPFAITKNAPELGLVVAQNGVGMGTLSPSAPLELLGTDTFNFFRITAEGAAVNESVDITFTGGPLGTGQLRYNIVDGDNQEMSLDANGNMVLDGTLTTAGPTCAAGCDRVFNEEYTLLSIEEHAAEMFANQHLPAMGPTVPHAPVNMTEQMSNMLNELEHAHIYIAQLKAEHVAAQVQMLDKIAALSARLEAVERP